MMHPAESVSVIDLDLPVEEVEDDQLNTETFSMDWKHFEDPSVLVTLSLTVLMRQTSQVNPLCGTVIKTFNTKKFQVGQRVVWFSSKNIRSTEVLVPVRSAAAVPTWMEDLEAVTYAEAAVPGAQLANMLDRGQTQHMVVVDVLRPEGIVAAQLAKVHGVKRVVGVTAETRYDETEKQTLSSTLQLDLTVSPIHLTRNMTGADLELSMTTAVFDASGRPTIRRFVEPNMRQGTCYVSCDRSHNLSCLRFHQIGHQLRFAFRLCSYVEGFAWFGAKEAKVFGPQLESILEILDPRVMFRHNRAVCVQETDEITQEPVEPHSTPASFSVHSLAISPAPFHVSDPATDQEIERSFGVDLSVIKVMR